MKFNIITLFPDAFPGILDFGLIGKALKNQCFSLNIIDLKHFSINGRVDDRPCGGGPGMIIKPEIIEKCLMDSEIHEEIIFFLSPRGSVFNAEKAKFIQENMTEMTFLCGRYEGIDQRLFKKFKIIEISLGDFILCGGEVAAMTMIESIVRLIPGVLHNEDSAFDESFSNSLLEHDHYTKPILWKDLSVPEVLLSGHHKNINNWKLQNSIQNTKLNRPDLVSNLSTILTLYSFYSFIIKNNPLI